MKFTMWLLAVITLSLSCGEEAARFENAEVGTPDDAPSAAEEDTAVGAPSSGAVARFEL